MGEQRTKNLVVAGLVLFLFGLIVEFALSPLLGIVLILVSAITFGAALGFDVKAKRERDATDGG